MSLLAVDWGPVGVWAGAIATFLAALIALLGSVGGFDRYRAPRLRLTFEQTEPWCRGGVHPVDGEVLWVRVGVENVGQQPARGCVGRLTGIATDGMPRADVDSVQLRWAGVPPVAVLRPGRCAARPARVRQRSLCAGGVTLADRDVRRRRLHPGVHDGAGRGPAPRAAAGGVRRQCGVGDEIARRQVGADEGPIAARLLDGNRQTEWTPRMTTIGESLSGRLVGN